MTTPTGTQMAMAPREEDLADLEQLLRDLQSKVDEARDSGRVFMMQEYVRLVALVSPEIDRIQRRFKRESLANFRKEHKDLKSLARVAQADAKEAAAAAVRNRANA